MCVDYKIITVFSQGCNNPDCNKIELIPGPDCPHKPAIGSRNTCCNYEIRHGASNRVKVKVSYTSIGKKSRLQVLTHSNLPMPIRMANLPCSLVESIGCLSTIWFFC